MRKCLSFVLTMLLVFTMAITPVAAGDTSSSQIKTSDSDVKVTTQAVQTVLQKVKTIFNIDDTGKEFSYNSSNDTETGMLVYNFTWSDKMDDSAINVTVDKNGFVRSYSNSKDDSSQEETKQVPKLSKKEALNIAYDQAITIFPGAKDQISKDMATVSSSYNNTAYSVTFDREIDGVAVHGNSLSLNIDCMTGALSRYNVSVWAINVQDIDKSTLLSKEDVQKSFGENMPLELTYTTGYNEDTKKSYTYLVYTPSNKDSNYYIDARTGEKIKINETNRYYATGSSGGGSAPMEADSKNSLSAAEIAETEKHSNFITEQKATSILSSIDNLDFDKTLPVESSNATSSKSQYTDNTTYHFSASWNKEKQGSCYAQFDAVTGELLSYSNYNWTDGSKTPSKYISSDSAKQKAESFLKAQKSAKFQTSKFSENTNRVYYLTGKNAENQDSYSFNYYRLVNGIPFYNDYMCVTVDGATGKVTGYYENWSDATFDSAKDAMTAEQAMNSYVKFFDLNYYYVPVTENEDKELEMAGWNNSFTASFQMIPVYKYESSIYIDAKKGSVLGYDLKPYDKVNTYTNLDSLYPQLNGHYAKDIVLKLFDMGIEVQNKDFDPDGLITQAEFEALAQNIGGSHPYYYYANGYKGAATSTEADAKESQPLTRIEAVKMIVDNLGFQKLAEKSSIFNCTFTDKNDINSEDIGYVAAAKGLGISVGTDNQFLPNKQITYAEAFIMIYRALNV